jgi:hypothetical protein
MILSIYLTIIYFCLKTICAPLGMNSKKLHFNITSFISILHATYVSHLAVDALMSYNYDYFQNVIYQSDPSFIIIAKIITQYLVFDLMIMIYESNYQKAMLIHHIYSIIGLSFAIYYDTALYLVVWCSLNEISTMPLGCIPLLKCYPSLQHKCKQIFAASFVIFRILLLPYVIQMTLSDYDYIDEDDFRLFTFILGFFIVHGTMNLYWLYRIIGMVFG